MAITDLFRPTKKPARLWEPQAEALIQASLQAAEVASSAHDRAQWAKLRAFLDGVHSAHVQAAAHVSHPQDSREWDKGDGHAYRFLRLVEMLAERLSVAFFRPPETFLHTGDGVALQPDDPRYGEQVQQWEQDAEDAELDVVLSGLDATVSVLGQAIVSPSWVSDGDYGAIKWLVHDPQEVYIYQSAVAPSDIALARAVSVEIRQPTDTIGATKPPIYSTWTRTVQDSGTAYAHYVHDGGGEPRENPLFPDCVNGYGALPVVLWQTRKPSAGCILNPPDEALIQAQLGVDIALTDLAYGLKFYSHPQWIATGQMIDQNPVFGPGRLVQMVEGGTLSSVTPDTNITDVIAAIEWFLKVEATSRSLPPDILNPGAARNLAALKEQRHDLRLRRERVVPFYRRAFRKTAEMHMKVGNYWADNGADRVKYSPEIQVGIRLAPIPEVEDRWQAAQSRQLEYAQGIGSAVQDLMDRDGIARDEAERRVAANLKAAPGGSAPLASTAGGGGSRPADVERG